MIEYRNAKFASADLTIVDCEINHPRFGWLPYTINPADTDQAIDNEALLAAIGDDVAPYVPAPQASAQEVLAAWRASAYLYRDEFAVVAAGNGWVTDDEAEAWAGGNANPPSFLAIIGGLPEGERLAARVTSLTRATVRRDSPLIVALAVSHGVDDEGLDMAFGWVDAAAE
jgi:hypothetical protein